MLKIFSEGESKEIKLILRFDCWNGKKWW